jgi:ankyrin repeat protein
MIAGKKEYTPLHLAAIGGHLGAVLELLANGADIKGKHWVGAHND